MVGHSSHPLVRALDDVIAGVETAQFQESATLLRIARLDLAIRVHSIEAYEVELLTDALARQPKRTVKKKAVHKKSATKTASRAR